MIFPHEDQANPARRPVRKRQLALGRVLCDRDEVGTGPFHTCSNRRPSVGGVVEQEVEMLAKSGCWLLALCVALAVPGPAGAKEKEKPSEIVAVSGSGVGVAPRAPAWVRERVEEIHAGKVENGGADGPGALRGPEARKRISWIGCRDVWAYRGYDHIFGYNL
ncbi:MAG TPA: hypothetical protein VLS46_05545, partial [Gaiellaceae bacterium]|nr:hypothetical protein [Gaiellaceae bacterium]